MENKNYTEDAIRVVTGLEHVRLRPSMYIGDVSERGLHHLIWEIVDNSVDEAMAGYANSIKVVIHEDESVSVEDNGRGIPVHIHPEVGKPAVEVVLTVLGAGGKFDKKVYQYSGGLHGVGASVVNALSEWLIVEVSRDGHIYRQEYERGVPKTELKIIGESSKSGTKITFKPDPLIFETTKIKYDILEKRLRELAYLNKNVTFYLRDDRTKKEITFLFREGIKQMVLYLSEGKEKLFDEVIYIEGEKEGVITEIGFIYTKDYKESLESFVNNIKTVEGGTHVIGFRSALSRVVLKLASNLKFQKEMLNILSSDDLREGLVAVISCKVPEPQFEGQTKTKLGNAKVKNIVENIVYEFLSDFFDKRSDILRLIVEKAIEAALAREAAKKAKDLVRRKSFLEDSTLPGKLADCSEKDPSLCEIFIVEGESAGGSAKQGRDRRFQAILPLKGKILNVEKARLDKALSNEEIRSIITALGGIKLNPQGAIDEDIDLESLRYHKIIIMTDADIDGSHIRTLLLTFFYRFMFKLIERGFVYIAQPPLYKAKIGKKELYFKDDKELESFLLSSFEKEGSLIESTGKVLVKEDLKAYLLNLREIEDFYLNASKTKSEHLLSFLFENRVSSEDIKDNEKRKELIDKLSKENWVYSAEEHFDEFDKTYSILLTDEKEDIIILDQEFLSSPTYKKIVKSSLDFPVLVKFGNKTKEIKNLFNAYSEIINTLKEGMELQRYKGLGEMNPEQLWETTMNPKTRRLVRVSIEDAAEADRIFSVLMGEEVEPRREFIEKYAKEVKNLDV